MAKKVKKSTITMARKGQLTRLFEQRKLKRKIQQIKNSKGPAKLSKSQQLQKELEAQAIQHFERAKDLKEDQKEFVNFDVENESQDVSTDSKYDLLETKVTIDSDFCIGQSEWKILRENCESESIEAFCNCCHILLRLTRGETEFIASKELAEEIIRFVLVDLSALLVETADVGNHSSLSASEEWSELQVAVEALLFVTGDWIISQADQHRILFGMEQLPKYCRLLEAVPSAAVHWTNTIISSWSLVSEIDGAQELMKGALVSVVKDLNNDNARLVWKVVFDAVDTLDWETMKSVALATALMVPSDVDGMHKAAFVAIRDVAVSLREESTDIFPLASNLCFWSFIIARVVGAGKALMQKGTAEHTFKQMVHPCAQILLGMTRRKDLDANAKLDCIEAIVGLCKCISVYIPVLAPLDAIIHSSVTLLLRKSTINFEDSSATYQRALNLFKDFIMNTIRYSPALPEIVLPVLVGLRPLSKKHTLGEENMKITRTILTAVQKFIDQSRSGRERLKCPPKKAAFLQALNKPEGSRCKEQSIINLLE